MSLVESGTSSPRGAFSKLRSRSKGLASSSTTSLASSAGDGDGDELEGKAEDSTLDPSRLHSPFDKAKDRPRRRSVQEDRVSSEETSGRRLSTFVSNTKRKIKRDRGHDVERTLSADSAAGLEDQSDSSPMDGSGRSSLLVTDDERMDTNK